MNRIIKFRAWDYNHKKYRYPKLWDNTMPSNWNEWFMLEQFTGMTDKNGTEIYEGDVLAHYHYVNYSKAVMRWDDHNAAWTKFHPLDQFEVIGNVHQHPELICT